MNADEVRNQLREKIGNGTQAEYAKKLGISATYLSEILRGFREPAAVVLDRLGLTREVIYLPKRGRK
jgi:transcriptional regulator with XRE-family HTH domain